MSAFSRNQIVLPGWSTDSVVVYVVSACASQFAPWKSACGAIWCGCLMVSLHPVAQWCVHVLPCWGFLRNGFEIVHSQAAVTIIMRKTTGQTS